MKVVPKTLTYKTEACLDFIDITDEVLAFIKEAGIKEGLVNVQTLHTTACLMVNEDEPLLLEDMKGLLEKIAPQTFRYRHDDLQRRDMSRYPDKKPNGHAHCKALLLLPNVTFNLINRELQLGRWQRLFLIELCQAKERKVQIQIIGE